MDPLQLPTAALYMSILSALPLRQYLLWGATDHLSAFRGVCGVGIVDISEPVIMVWEGVAHVNRPTTAAAYVQIRARTQCISTITAPTLCHHTNTRSVTSSVGSAPASSTPDLDLFWDPLWDPKFTCFGFKMAYFRV